MLISSTKRIYWPYYCICVSTLFAVSHVFMRFFFLALLRSFSLRLRKKIQPHWLVFSRRWKWRVSMFICDFISSYSYSMILFQIWFIASFYFISFHKWRSMFQNVFFRPPKKEGKKAIPYYSVHWRITVTCSKLESFMGGVEAGCDSNVLDTIY